MSSTQPKFFGLTALGAPCPYNPNLLSTVTISIFEEEDVEDAFRATSLSSASGEEFLKDFMAALYGGDFPELEFQRLKGLVEETCDIRTSIPTLKQIKTSVEALQVEGERRQAASEYGVGSGSEHESNQVGANFIKRLKCISIYYSVYSDFGIILDLARTQISSSALKKRTSRDIFSADHRKPKNWMDSTKRAT